MKVYGTIDEEGVDSFTFDPEEAGVQKSKAFISCKKGIKYFEFTINEEEKEWMINKEIEKAWVELGEFVRERIKRILKGDSE